MSEKRTFSRFSVACLAFSLLISQAIAQNTKWVGTWAAAPYDVGTNTAPSPFCANNSLRQIIRVSIGGDTLRFKFSNEASSGQLNIKSVKIAVAKTNGSIDATTTKELKFSNSAAVTIAGMKAVYSDPIAFKITPRMDVAITILYGTTPTPMTGHPGSRTNSYLLAGDKTTAADFTGAVKTEHWFTISALEVRAPATTYAVAAFGNSITDGRGTTTDLQDRWTDFFSEALLKNPSTSQVSVLNLGIGGNTVLGSGNSGVNRFNRDILGQEGVKWLIILHGVNDIGSVYSDAQATTTANNLITAYKKFISDAHAKNIKVYGATILPFKGNGYYRVSSDSCRRIVNKWIRTGGFYDGVIDFDKVMRDPADTAKLKLPAFENDGLHPTGAGYKVMGESIDLSLFSDGGVVAPPPPIEQKPYKGVINLPGTVQVEDYDIGGEGVSFHDATAGNSGNSYRTDDVDIDPGATATEFNVGWTAASEWLEYSVNIAQSPLATQPAYGIEASVAANANGSTFHLEIDGKDISGTLTVPNTQSWKTFQTIQVVAKEAITPGAHVLRLVIDNGSLNIDWIRFSEPISSILHNSQRNISGNYKVYNAMGIFLGHNLAPFSGVHYQK